MVNMYLSGKNMIVFISHVRIFEKYGIKYSNCFIINF